MLKEKIKLRLIKLGMVLTASIMVFLAVFFIAWLIYISTR